MRLVIGLVASWFLLVGSATAAEPDPRELVRRVLDRDDGSSQVAVMRVSTCRYTRSGKSIRCAETPREKVMQQVSKDHGADGKDSRGLSLVLEPVAERGIGFIQHDYDAEDKESDQWIFLSALGKVKRVASGSTEQPKTGSFFGSEIPFEDMERRKLDHYDYRVLQNETYQGRPCVVVEAVPRSEYARRYSYGKRWTWIDPERDLVLKRMLFDRRGKKVKRITFRDIRQVSGVWLVGRIEVNNLATGRVSTITLESVALNVDVPDEYLTQRALTDRAFRERVLAQYEDVFGP